MAKKKKKRIAFKAPRAASLPEVAGTPATRSRAISAASTGGGGAASLIADTRFAYAGIDLRRIGVLAIICVAVELIAWYVLNYTGVGPHVYSLIHI